MSDYVPTVAAFRGVYGQMCAEWFRDDALAEFDRFIARVKAEALRDVAEATSRDAAEEPYAGALFTAYADGLEELADRIEQEAGL